MGKLLYFIIGMPSYYNSGVGLAIQLRDYGFDVEIACDKDISELLSESGLAFHHLDEGARISSAIRKNLVAYPHKDKLRLTLFKLKQFWKYRKESLKATEVSELCNKVKPDGFLIDIEFHYAIVVCLKYGLPTCLVSRWFSTQRGQGIPPLHSKSLPATTFASRLAIRGEWLKLSIFQRKKACMQWVSKSRLSPVQYRTISGVDLQALATAQGVALQPQTTQKDWLIPHSYTRIPIVSLTAKEMDFPNVATHNFYHAGPVIGQTNYAFRISDQLNAQKDNFISNAKSQQQKLIYCSLGTFLHTNESFISIIKELAQKRVDLAFILSLGGQKKTTQDSSPLPRNMLVLQAAPQIELLKSADAAILHAGIGSINETISTGTPFLSYSVGSNDQNGCAARLKYHKLCETGHIDSITLYSIEESVDRMIMPNRYSENLHVMQNKFLMYDANNSCGKLIASLLVQ